MQMQIIKDELLEIKEKYGDERRTEIAHVSGEVDIEDLIPEETCVFTLTHAGYIKRQPADTYQAQRRGGARHYGAFAQRRRLCRGTVPCLYMTTFCL